MPNEDETASTTADEANSGKRGSVYSFSSGLAVKGECDSAVPGDEASAEENRRTEERKSALTANEGIGKMEITLPDDPMVQVLKTSADSGGSRENGESEYITRWVSQVAAARTPHTKAGDMSNASQAAIGGAQSPSSGPWGSYVADSRASKEVGESDDGIDLDG